MMFSSPSLFTAVIAGTALYFYNNERQDEEDATI